MKIVSVLILIVFTLSSAHKNDQGMYVPATTVEFSKTKNQAFEILENKCNVCHSVKNKKRVFTKDNMNGYSQKIYNQVFKWKRMPKGNENNLTKEEYIQLERWLSALTIN